MGGRRNRNKHHSPRHGGGGGLNSFMRQQMADFHHQNYQSKSKRNRSAAPAVFARNSELLPKQHYGKITFGSKSSAGGGSSISPERRRQLELERKKREEYENNFKCEVQESAPGEIFKLLKGADVYKQGRRVTYPMTNWGNTCFFNSVMQCFMHTIPLH